MAGCSSCGGKRTGVAYEVTFANGNTQKYDTVSEARAAGSASGGSYTFRAVTK